MRRKLYDASRTFYLFQYPPESARFLVSIGKNEEATKILENAARDNGKELPEGTLEKTKIIQVCRRAPTWTKLQRNMTKLFWQKLQEIPGFWPFSNFFWAKCIINWTLLFSFKIGKIRRDWPKRKPIVKVVSRKI